MLCNSAVRLDIQGDKLQLNTFKIQLPIERDFTKMPEKRDYEVINFNIFIIF